jgi:hypothetical protein
MEFLRRSARTTILAVGAVILFVSMAFGYWLNVGDNDKEVVTWLLVCAVGTLIMAGLLLRFVPDTEAEADGNAPARRALVLGIVALITCALFWSGLPIVIGIPALVLGAEGRARAETYDGGAEATAGAVLGGFAALATIVLLITGA